MSAFTLIDETGAGLSIGGAATVGKVAFWGKTPAVQPTNASQAAVTASAANAITDSSGGVDPGNNTIAAVTNLDTLTNSTGGTADDTLDAVTQQAGGAGVELTDGDAAKINNNFKELFDQVVTQKAANTAILAAIAQLAAKVNTDSTAITSIKTLVNRLRTDLVALGLIKGS